MHNTVYTDKTGVSHDLVLCMIPYQFGFVLFNDTTDLSKDVRAMYNHTFSKLAKHQISRQATLKMGCEPGCQSGDCKYGHFNLPQRFVWVCMD